MPKGTLKIFAFSDLHGDRSLLEEHVRKAQEEDVDLVIIAGDFSSAGKDEVPKGLIQPFLHLGKKVFVLHGNHDTEATVKFIERRYGLKSLHGYYSVNYKGVGIFGAGGADIGPFPTNDFMIFDGLRQGWEKIKHLSKKVMVTHVHPQGSRIEDFTTVFPGSPSVKRAIEEFHPDIAICGHVHEAEGIEEKIGNTTIINISRTGKIIEIPISEDITKQKITD